MNQNNPTWQRRSVSGSTWGKSAKLGWLNMVDDIKILGIPDDDLIKLRYDFLSHKILVHNKIASALFKTDKWRIEVNKIYNRQDFSYEKRSSCMSRSEIQEDLSHGKGRFKDGIDSVYEFLSKK